MATPPDNELVPEWVDDDPEIELTMEMDDEEREFDEFSDEEDELVADAGRKDAARDYVPLWRLIEMSEEDRSLRMELADFEDYDDLDGSDSDYAGGLSH
ncbi:MAG TPA: hypothetical protein VE175_02810 [Woeseiaceae bacterium]|jgi:hypothetical protein|nr:hypothetical protein [Woeseiaceae bacterium]